MAKKWVKFPHAGAAYEYDATGLKKNWDRLHRGDREPFPADPASQEAWRLHHAGDFGASVARGREAGGSGLHAAIKSQVIYATYLEKSAAAKLALLEEAMHWADEARKAHPRNACAHYLYAFAVGRYGQCISVGKALAQGLGGRIKESLETAIKLDPKHADAHIAFGAYQSEVIEKVGGLVAGVTYGAKKDSATAHFEKAIALNPDVAIAKVEFANGLIRLFGKSRLADAERLYEEAAKCRPADAMERLDVELAKSELA
jgi:tetratricopeptide (TPR) repeat protein